MICSNAQKRPSPRREPTMTDAELTKAVADLWVKNGGDADGFDWLRRRIREEIELRGEEADHDRIC